MTSTPLPEASSAPVRRLPPANPAGDPKGSLPPVTASRKVDDLSRHEAKHDLKHLPEHGAPEAIKPRADQKQGGKPMPTGKERMDQAKKV